MERHFGVQRYELEVEYAVLKKHFILRDGKI